jgi:hypothetical protein
LEETTLNHKKEMSLYTGVLSCSLSYPHIPGTEVEKTPLLAKAISPFLSTV